MEMGCFGAHPFGALTLVDYLRRAREIAPGVNNAFVMSDDAPWLAAQIKALPHSNTDVADMKVGQLSAEKDARLEFNTPTGQHNNGTKYAVDFWTSVTISRTCKAFVGHWGSAVSKFVHAAMCFQHKSTTGHCPLASDIGTGANIG